MKNNLILLNLATLTALAIVVLHGQGSGPLLPPGPPTNGTYKTLGQVEPRSDLANVPGDANTMHVIDQPGSYYLSGNLDVTTTNGIEIRASGVTLDLMGFNILRSSSAAATGTAIVLNGARLSNVAIKNGHITGGVTYDAAAPGDQFAGPGFSRGVFSSLATEAANVRVTDLGVSGCDLGGIDLGNGPRGISNTVANCSIITSGGSGIAAGEVHTSTALECGEGAIIASGNVTKSHGESVGSHGTGISASGTVSDSIGFTTGTSETSHGIRGSNIANSKGTTFGGAGLWAGTCVQNSWGSGAQFGISAGSSVSNSSGSCTEGPGIWARYAVSNSTGSSGWGNGIVAEGVSNCRGWSSRGAGINGEQVSNSKGTSSSSHGIAGQIVSNSFGMTDGSGEAGADSHGILASAIASYSYGWGSELPAGSGRGLRASRAIGCSAAYGETITYKYLMP